MGYQLYWVRLCIVGELVGVAANGHSPAAPNAAESAATDGGAPLQVVQRRVPPCPVVVVQTGGVPTELVAPGSAASALAVRRSAGCCSIRIACGLIGFGLPPAGVPAPDCVGGVTPRA